MHQFVRSHGLLPTLTREAPAGLATLVVAEVFYKFHSFTLECLAFLATWYVLSWLLSLVIRRRKTDSTSTGG